jgi:hypothetical protein
MHGHRNLNQTWHPKLNTSDRRTPVSSPVRPASHCHGTISYSQSSEDQKWLYRQVHLKYSMSRTNGCHMRRCVAGGLLPDVSENPTARRHRNVGNYWPKESVTPRNTILQNAAVLTSNPDHAANSRNTFCTADALLITSEGVTTPRVYLLAPELFS